MHGRRVQLPLPGHGEGLPPCFCLQDAHGRLRAAGGGGGERAGRVRDGVGGGGGVADGGDAQLAARYCPGPRPRQLDTAPRPNGLARGRGGGRCVAAHTYTSFTVAADYRGALVSRTRGGPARERMDGEGAGRD